MKDKPCHCRGGCLGTKGLLDGYYCAQGNKKKGEDEPLHPIVYLLAKMAANQCEILRFIQNNTIDTRARQDLQNRINELNAMGEMFEGNINLNDVPLKPIVTK